MPKVYEDISELSEGNGHATEIGDGGSPALDRLLRKLRKVSRTSNGWQANCPCHEADGKHSPSFSVGTGTDGRLLLHCHAGCSFKDIVSALGMQSSNFAPGNSARSTTLKKKTKGGLAERLKSLSALDGRKSEPVKPKSLSALEEDELLLGVVNREDRRLGEDASRPTPFPLDVFPKALKRFVDESAASLPCPPDYIGLAVLVVTSSFVGAGRPIQLKGGWEERAAIYGVTVGPTGSRKTPALELGMMPARVRDKKLAAEHKIAIREYERNRRAAKSNKDDFNAPSPVAEQHITTDTTVEALADVLGWNPRGLLVYRDEATGWVASLNQYKGGHGADRQFWLSAWSSQDYTVNRKGQEPLRITRPYLSVIGNIPPDMLGELADRRGREDGFLDRILFAYPDPVRVKWTDTSPDPELLKSYVDACLRIGKQPDAVLTLTTPARAEFSVWYDEHNRSSDGPAGSWAKMDGYCARLANVIHHLRHAYGEVDSRDEVDVASVHSAIALIDYFKNHARRALGRMNTGREGRVFARLLAFVVNAPDYRVRPRSLIAAQIAANADEAKALLQRLASLGLGELVEGRRKDELIFQGRQDLEEIAGQFEEPESS